MQRDETLEAAVAKQFTEKLLRHFSASLAQSSTVVKQTLAQLAVLVAHTLQDRVVRPNGEEAIWTLTAKAQREQVLRKLLTPDVFKGCGGRLMQGLLGGTYELTFQRMSVSTGVPVPACLVLLEVAVAAVLGTLGQVATRQELDAATLGHWLAQQPRVAPVMSATKPIPPPQPLPKAVVAPPRRMPLPAKAVEVAPTTSVSNAPEVPEKDSLHRFTVAGAGTWEKVGGGITFTPAMRVAGKRWKLPLPALPRWKWAYAAPLVGVVFLVGYGGGYFLLSPTPPPVAGQVSQSIPTYFASTTPRTLTHATLAASSAAQRLIAPAGGYPAGSNPEGEAQILILPDGNRQWVGVYSTEYRLYRLLAVTSRSDSLSRPAALLPVDRVSFVPGKAILTEESRQQLQNLAGILKAFPRAVIRLVASPDTTGAGRRHEYLALERAVAAKRALMDLGVASQRLVAQGYEAQAVPASVGQGPHRPLSLEVFRKPEPLFQPPAESPRRAKKVAHIEREASSRRAGSFRASVVRDGSKSRSKVGQWLQQLSRRVRGKRNTSG